MNYKLSDALVLLRRLKAPHRCACKLFSQRGEEQRAGRSAHPRLINNTMEGHRVGGGRVGVFGTTTTAEASFLFSCSALKETWMKIFKGAQILLHN